MSIFRKGRKAIGHIGETKLPCTIEFTLLKVKVSAKRSLTLRPRISRDSKQAAQMDTFEVEVQDYAKVVTTSSLTTSFNVTMFIKHNAPVEKQCKVDLMIVDNNGAGSTVVASLDLNVEDHFGAAFTQRTYRMMQT